MIDSIIEYKNHMAKKKIANKSRLPLLLTILLTSVLILGALTIHRSTQLSSQANRLKTLPKQTTVEYFFKNGNTGFTVPGKNNLTAATLCSTVENSLWVSRYVPEILDMEHYDCSTVSTNDRSNNFTILPHVGYVMGVSQDTYYEITFEETAFDTGNIISDTLTGLHYRSFDQPFYAQDVCDDFAARGQAFRHILPIEELTSVYSCNDGLPHDNFEIKPYHSYWVVNFIIFDRGSSEDITPVIPQLRYR